MDKTLLAAARALGERQHARAVELARAYLEGAPDDFDGLHVLGIALCETGALEEGKSLIERATAARPGNPEPHYNLGNVLLARGDLEEAETRFRKTLELAPNHFSAWNNLGSLLTRAGRVEEAARAYESVLRIQPRHPGAHKNLANVLALLGHGERAEAAYREALRLQPHDLAAVQALGALLFSDGRLREAIELAESALARHPDDPGLRNIIGVLLIQTADYAAAEKHLRRGLALDPDSSDLRDNLGVALSNLGDAEQARACHEAVLARDPAHGRATANLAELLEMTNDIPAARNLAADGLRRTPDHPVLNLVMAKCERRDGDYGAAAARLEPIVSRADAAAPRLKSLHFELGRIYDRMARFDEAFRQFERANALVAERWKAMDGGADPLLPAVDHLQQRFDSTWPGGWRQLESGPRAPAFLLGFQRSGTTLLDTILDSHSQVRVIEESPALLNVMHELASSRSYPDCLSELSDEELADLRARYYRELGRQQRSEGLLLDKSPLHSVHLGLIQRLFPGAPIILMIRHPLDVCLSCFMQDFTPSGFITNFLKLETTVTAYSKVMRLEQTYERVLPLNLLQVRYEDLVADFDHQVGRVLSFLGLEWEERMRRFDAHARDKGLILTPSYHQVSQPIYRHAAYRWRNYARHLEPYSARLADVAQRFGYEL